MPTFLILSPLADDDSFLPGVPLHIDDCHDMDGALLFIELLHDHFGAVGNLLVIVEQQFLADYLRDEKRAGLSVSASCRRMAAIPEVVPQSAS